MLRSAQQESLPMACASRSLTLLQQAENSCYFHIGIIIIIVMILSASRRIFNKTVLQALYKKLKKLVILILKFTLFVLKNWCVILN